MEIDVASALGLVRRRVRNFEKDGKPASTVTLTRLYDTGVDDLWDALTNKGTHPAMVPAGRGRAEVGRKVPAQGECGRYHYGLHAAESFCSDVGIRRRDELGRRQVGSGQR